MVRSNGLNYGTIFGYGSGNSFYSNLSQLQSVRNGAYSKALKAYYGKNNSGTTSSQKNHVSNKNRFSTYAADKGLSEVSKESAELSDAAKKLANTGKDSFFASRENYDADAAYQAVSDFVSSYNETLDAVEKTTNATVSRAAGSMTRMTGMMTGSLGKIGISIGKDGKMSLDEEKFKNAGFDQAKSVLGTNGSFARIIGSSAQRLGSTAEQQSRQSMSNSGIYSRYGSYFDNYYGTQFNGWY